MGSQKRSRGNHGPGRFKMTDPHANETGVKRYDCTNGGAQFCQGCYRMDEDEQGDYVRWEDYERLLAKVATLEKTVERYADAMEEDGDVF